MTIKEYLKRAQYVILGREKGVYTLLDTQNDEVITKTKKDIQNDILEHEKTQKWCKGVK